jgi:hypothetical protein
MPRLRSLARMDVCGGMVKLVYTEALKASSPQGECGFDSHSRYQIEVLRPNHFLLAAGKWRRVFEGGGHISKTIRSASITFSMVSGLTWP